ncbi:MAG: hypothetical protein IJ228_13520 [Succinivibrio sp.]|nr:hypothetical protein [Succinivibrio sp.]
MQFTVTAKELFAALARLDEVTQDFDTKSIYSHATYLMLRVRQGVLTLKVSDELSTFSVTLQVAEQLCRTPRTLQVEREALREALQNFTPAELLLFSTEETRWRRYREHEHNLVEDHYDYEPDLYLVSQSYRCTLKYLYDEPPPAYEFEHEEICQRLSLSARTLRALLQYAVCCTAPHDYRDFLSGPQLKLLREQPQTLLCTASDGYKVAALEAQLCAPSDSQYDLECILRPRTVQQLLQLLGGESEEELLMEFSSYKCRIGVAGCTLKSSFIRRAIPDRRRIIPGKKRRAYRKSPGI